MKSAKEFWEDTYGGFQATYVNEIAAEMMTEYANLMRIEILNTILHRQLAIKSESDGIKRETMFNRLLKDL